MRFLIPINLIVAAVDFYAFIVTGDLPILFWGLFALGAAYLVHYTTKDDLKPVKVRARRD